MVIPIDSKTLEPRQLFSKVINIPLRASSRVKRCSGNLMPPLDSKDNKKSHADQPSDPWGDIPEGESLVTAA